MIYVVATASVKPEKREDYMAGARACAVETVKEKGCLLYDCHASIGDPGRFVFVEKWESRDDLMAHAKSDHMRVWRKLSADFLAGPTKIEIITPEKVDVL